MKLDYKKFTLLTLDHIKQLENTLTFLNVDYEDKTLEQIKTELEKTSSCDCQECDCQDNTWDSKKALSKEIFKKYRHKNIFAR